MKQYVSVRVAVAVDPSGKWNASGWGEKNGPVNDGAMDIAMDGVSEGENRYWLTALLPVPHEPHVEAEVEKV